MKADLILFTKARGWWSPQHGGTHVKRGPVEGDGGASGDASDFAVSVSRKGKEARFDVEDRFFAWLGVDPHPVWADVERLQRKHPEYFPTTDDVVQHIHGVLSSPWAAMPASDERFTLLIAPLSRREHRSAVVRFELHGNQYRVRNAQKMPDEQADGKVQRAGEKVLRRPGRVSGGPVSDVTSESQPSIRGPDTRLARRSPTKLNPSMDDDGPIFKALASNARVLFLADQI